MITCSSDKYKVLDQNENGFVLLRADLVAPFTELFKKQDIPTVVNLIQEL